MAKAPKQTAVAVKETGGDQLPDYLKGHKGGSGLQGLDQNDFIIPRIKLLQGISPELETHEDAKSGIFWLNVLDIPLSEVGGELKFVPISNRKRYLLMAPRSDSRTILARADDAVHWNPPEGEFDIKLKGVAKPVKWKLAPTVKESGLDQFGSSNPDDPDSVPAAVLMYEYLVRLPDFPDLGPVLMSLSRSQAKKAKDLNGKIDLRRVPMQSQLFAASIVKENHSDGDYNNYVFKAIGFATEEMYDENVALAERYKEYRGADEEGVVDEENHKGAPAESSEF